MSKAYATCKALIHNIDRCMVFIAAISLLIIMMVVVYAVVLRYFFNSPPSWSYEFISLYLIVILFFFSLSDTLGAGAHISVDILHTEMTERYRHLCIAFGYWISSVVFLLITYLAAQETWIKFIDNELTGGLIQWPLWLSWISVPIGTFAISVHLVVDAIGHTLAISQKYADIIELPAVAGYEKD